MAYMRGTYYVWSDGDCIHINDETMPMEVFDELVVMHYAKMDAGQKAAATTRAIENHSGNFSVDALRAQEGLPTVMEMLHNVRNGYGD